MALQLGKHKIIATGPVRKTSDPTSAKRSDITQAMLGREVNVTDIAGNYKLIGSPIETPYGWVLATCLEFVVVTPPGGDPIPPTVPPPSVSDLRVEITASNDVLVLHINGDVNIVFVNGDRYIKQP